MLKLTDFSPVSLEDKDTIQRYLQKYPQVHSDNSIITMLCWNCYAHYHYAIVDDSLIIMSIVGGIRTFRPPIGPENDLLLSELFSLAYRRGGEIPLQMLDQITHDRVAQMYPDLPIYQDRDFADYIYRSKDLADLAGKKYLTIRREINRFQRSQQYTIETISIDMIDEIREFLVEWCEWKHCDESPALAYERDAVLYAVDHFQDLGCQGLVIRTRDGIGALSIYSELNDETIVIHFEKALPGFEGIYKVISMMTAQAVEARYRFINRESDMGSAGLREAKTRYHPDHMAPVCYVKRSDIERYGYGVSALEDEDALLK